MAYPEKSEKLRILVLLSDLGGCYHYRVRIPHEAITQYGAVWFPYSFLPMELGNPNSFNQLLSMIRSFDLVVVQRCYLKPVVEKVLNACQIVSIPCIFETDDDYLSIIPSNPCYFALADQNLFAKFTNLQKLAQEANNLGKQDDVKRYVSEVQELLPSLIESRKQGVEDYKWILRNVDAVTVSTRELAWTIYPYNKNVKVFENNVQFCYPWKLEAPESAFITEHEGRKQVQIHNRLGMYTIPKFATVEHTIKGIKSTGILRTPRVGYTCTASHWGEDWNTVIDGINNVAKRNLNKAWYVMLGDNQKVFSSSITSDPGRVLTLPGSAYEMYRVNTGNIDIGLAPLAATTFNLCKSDIKFVEYASWGITSLLPRQVTYMRSAKENDTCLAYSNQREFEENLELLLKSTKTREEIGQNALDYIIKNRLSWLEKNSYPRYEFYKELTNTVPRLRIY